jgi:hypothetical protein
LERGQNSGSSEINEIDAILHERGKTHGDFKVQAWIAQELKACVENGPNWALMTADKREAIHMVLHKISRIVCGDPDFKDAWDDIQGYARLISNKLTN